MTTSAAQRVHDALDRVQDPEVPITLRDLGVLRDVEVGPSYVRVRLVPTRVGCPGRDEMARRVRQAVLGELPDADVDIDWDMASWQSGDISSHGCTVLRGAGYTTATDTRCPYCDSSMVEQAGEFGGSLCKSPFSCRSCGSTFEALRGAALPIVTTG